MNGSIDSQKHLSFKLRLRSWFVIIFVIVVILIVTGSVLFIRNRKSTHQPKIAPTTLAQLDNVVHQAETQASKGNPQSGIAVYDKAIANTTDKMVLANLYMQKATLALNANLLDEALTAALKGDELLGKDGSSSLVAMIYAKKGDNSKAAEYYRKAATEVNPNRISGYSGQYYLDKAQELSGSKP